VRAFNDPNANRSLEGFEPRDTTAARVAVGARPAVELSIVAPDSTAPRPLEATIADSTITVRFDDFLDPAQRITTAQVTLLAPDSTPVRIASVALGTPTEPAAQPGAPRDSAAAGVRPPVRDTAAAAPAAPQRPVPARTIAVRVAGELRPDAQYTVRVTGMRNLVGLVGGGEVRFRTPRAAPAPAAAPPAGTPPAAPRPAQPATPAPARR
jgi:hypothetical protein